jgi:hypothetical protein
MQTSFLRRRNKPNDIARNSSRIIRIARWSASSFPVLISRGNSNGRSQPFDLSTRVRVIKPLARTASPYKPNPAGRGATGGTT